MQRPDIPNGMSDASYAASGYFPSPSVRWGVPLAVLAIALLPASVALSAWVATWDADLNVRRVIVLLVELLFYGGSLALVLVSSRRFGLGSLRADFGFEFRPLDVVWGLGLFVIALFLNRIGAALVYGITGVAPASDVTSHVPWVRITGGFVALVVVPFVEELVARGLIMRSLRHVILRGGRSPRPSETRQRVARVGSIVGSAILFSALHAPSRLGTPALPYELMSTVIFGLLAGWFATRTGRIGAGVVAHIAVNSLAYALSP